MRFRTFLQAFDFSNHLPRLQAFLSITLLLMGSTNTPSLLEKPLFVSNAAMLPLLSGLNARVLHYKDIPATEVSVASAGLFNRCRAKTTGASEGKICFANGKRYYFKTVKDPKDNDNNDVLLGEFNRRFIADNIGIPVPSASLVVEQSQGNTIFSIVSEEVSDLHRGDEYCTTKGDLSCSYAREPISKAVGETALAQLAIANTFIKDLHSLNWGLANQKLVIIDADQSPTTPAEYFKWAAKRFDGAGKGTIGFALSINNIREMSAFYKNMLKKSIPHYHHLIDMPYDRYQTILRAYIDATENVIRNASVELSHLSSSTPDPYVNKLFAASINVNYPQKKNSGSDNNSLPTPLRYNHTY